MTISTLNLHIDELLIDGLGEVNEHKVRTAVQSELQILLSSNGVHRSLQQSTAVKNIIARPLAPVQRGNDKRLGQQIANSVYRGMKG